MEGLTRTPLVIAHNKSNYSPSHKTRANKERLLDASMHSASSRRSIKLDFISKRSSFARWKNESPKNHVSYENGSNHTITLESSTDCEIINASVEEVATPFQWLRTPKSIRKEVPPKSTSQIRALIEETTVPQDLPKLPQCKSQNYLGKSKQRNIEDWLAASAAVTEAAPALTPSPEPVSDDDSMGIDPAVKDVLVAVYGSDWKDQRQNKCLTDYKRKRQVAMSVTKTDTNSKKRKVVSATLNKLPRNLFPKVSSVPRTEATTSLNPLTKSVTTNVRRNIFNNHAPTTSEASPGTPVVTRGMKDPSTPSLLPFPSTTKKKRRKPSVSTIESPVSLVPSPSSTPATPLPRSTTKGTPRRTFLASLSVSTPTTISHPDAQFYKLNFAKKKDELAAKLLKLYNSEVFENKLDSDLKMTWNPKMRGTAGFCYNKRSTRGKTVTRSARIELSTRVVDRADRLRDTLLHELCHAAAWVIDGVPDGHGPVWSSYAARARERFPEIPPISRRHNYEIAAKFTYKCMSCNYSINRQSRSIDLNRKRCGYCYGKFELLINKKKRGKAEAPEFNTTRTIKGPNNFALFVKDNYKKVKETERGKSHGEIMKILGQQYAIFKSVVTPGKK